MLLSSVLAAVFVAVLVSLIEGANHLVFNVGSSIRRVNMAQVEAATDNVHPLGVRVEIKEVIDDEHRKAITALAFDCETQSIFYSVPYTGVYKIGIKGDQKWTMAEGNYMVEGLAVDWVNRNLYWTESHNPRIMVSTITLRTTFHEIARLDVPQQPIGLAVFPKRKLLIWTRDFTSAIEMSDLDGKNRKVIPASPSEMLGGVSFSTTADKLFWTGRVKESVRSTSVASLLGGDLGNPVDEFSLDGPWSSGLVEWNGNVYWRSYPSNQANQTARMRRKNLRTGKVETLPFASLAFEEGEFRHTGDENDKYAAVTIATSTCPG